MANLTVNEFIRYEVNLWGFDYIEDLLDRGFEPQLVESSTGERKWIWLQTRSDLTANPSCQMAGRI